MTQALLLITLDQEIVQISIWIILLNALLFICHETALPLIRMQRYDFFSFPQIFSLFFIATSANTVKRAFNPTSDMTNVQQYASLQMQDEQLVLHIKDCQR